MNALVRGAWASLIATSSMAVTSFRAAQGLPPIQKSLSPMNFVTQKKKTPPNPESMTIATNIGYGLLGGAVYALLTSRSQANPLIKGSFFGLAVWAGTYYGLIPGVTLQKKSGSSPKKSVIMTLLSHIIWGASLGYAEHQLQHIRDRKRR